MTAISSSSSSKGKRVGERRGQRHNSNFLGRDQWDSKFAANDRKGSIATHMFLTPHQGASRTSSNLHLPSHTCDGLKQLFHLSAHFSIQKNHPPSSHHEGRNPNVVRVGLLKLDMMKFIELVLLLQLFSTQSWNRWKKPNKIPFKECQDLVS